MVILVWSLKTKCKILIEIYKQFYQCIIQLSRGVEKAAVDHTQETLTETLWGFNNSGVKNENS